MKTLKERIATEEPDGVLRDVTRGRDVPAWLVPGKMRRDGGDVEVWVSADEELLVIRGYEKPLWEILSLNAKGGENK